MRAEYDFSQSRENPYAKREKRQITMNIDAAALDYFKREAAATGVPYQTLINMYLMQCASQGLHVAFG